MVGQRGQEQRRDTDNDRKPHCEWSALAEVQHERRRDQEDRDRIVDQVGVEGFGDETERHRRLLSVCLLERVLATRKAYPQETITPPYGWPVLRRTVAPQPG